MKTLIAFFFASVFSVSALADAQQDFENSVYGAIKAGGITTEDASLDDVSQAGKQQLADRAGELAEVWVDTVLEGDVVFKPDSKVEVYGISKAFDKNGKFFAYLMNFGQEAYDVSNCDIEWNDSWNNPERYKEQLAEKCSPGSITAGAYVSPDFEFAVRDPDQIEDFSD